MAFVYVKAMTWEGGGMRTWHKWRAIAIGLLLSAMTTLALAGGVVVRRDTVSFEEGGPIVQPRSKVTVRLLVNEYVYGSGQYAYMPWAIIPAKSSIAPSAAELEDWEVYGILNGTPQRDLGLAEASSAYRLKFNAPEKAGKYKIVMGQIPLFRDAPLKTGAGYKESFVPHTSDRRTLATALTQYKGAISVVAEFVVANVPVVNDERPTLYLRMNGQVPSTVSTPGGLQQNPIEFSWSVGPEFKKDLKKVVYRYRMEPDDDDWGAWTPLQQVRYPFLLKGSHQFRVQAKYADGHTLSESFPAMYQFTLLKDHISKPTKETLTKGLEGSLPDNGKSITFSEVYAKSRALLVGMWRFDDATHFPQFDEGKISADVAAMEAALKRNGFEVTVLKRDRVRREDITKALDELVDTAGRNDRLFIYFSTHGFAHPTLPNEAYLATSDCQYASPTTRCLRLNDLRLQVDLALDGKQVRQILFAVDSCFAGLGIAMKSVGVPDLTRLAVPKGAFMLTAGMANQLAQIDPTLGMSTFTHYLADGLNGGADILGNNGLITLSELFVYVQYKVAEQTQAAQIPMLGRMKGDGEMIFLPAAKQ